MIEVGMAGSKSTQTKFVGIIVSMHLDYTSLCLLFMYLLMVINWCYIPYTNSN